MELSNEAEALKLHPGNFLTVFHSCYELSKKKCHISSESLQLLNRTF